MRKRSRSLVDRMSFDARFLRVRLPLLGIVAAGLVGLSYSADGRITQFQTTSRAVAFGGMSFGAVGQYETIVGRATGEVDPSDPLNAIITDIQLAPRNGNGWSSIRWTSCYKPVDIGQKTAICSVPIVAEFAVRVQHRRRCEQPWRRIPRVAGLHACR